MPQNPRACRWPPALRQLQRTGPRCRSLAGGPFPFQAHIWITGHCKPPRPQPACICPPTGKCAVPGSQLGPGRCLRMPGRGRAGRSRAARRGRGIRDNWSRTEVPAESALFSGIHIGLIFALVHYPFLGIWEQASSLLLLRSRCNLRMPL